MKYLLILLFGAIGLTASAQSTNDAVEKLMEKEVSMIKKDLTLNGQENKLTEDQEVELKKLLTVKAQKVSRVRESGADKLTMSQNFRKINDEYRPAILEILDDTQKAVYKASPRNARWYKK